MNNENILIVKAVRMGFETWKTYVMAIQTYVSNKKMLRMRDKGFPNASDTDGIYSLMIKY